MKDEIILGSHNSMSYLSPRCWWGWLMLPFARCQSKTIDEQIAAGVRCFDIRISFDSNSLPCFRHGWCQFGGEETLTSVLYRLQSYSNNGYVLYVRVILEEPLTLWQTIRKLTGFKVTQKPDDAQASLFYRNCKTLDNKYRDKNIIFIGGYRKFDWEHLYDFGNEDIPVRQYVSSMDYSAPWWQRILPKYYAKRHNKDKLRQIKPCINLFDFV